MRKLVLAAVLVLIAGGAQASSYLDIFGTVNDPIPCGRQDWVSQTCWPPQSHPYSGTDLAPGAALAGANLSYANLSYANLTGANLSNANLTNVILSNADLSNANLFGATLNFANLTGANLTNANLSGVSLGGQTIGLTWSGANLSGANLSGADLSGASLHAGNLGTTNGTPFYDAQTDFTYAFSGPSPNNGPSSPVDARFEGDFDPVAAGWTLVPEPNTALLVGLGLVGIAARRRV